MMKFIHRLQGDEEEGSLPQGNDNRSSAGYPPEPRENRKISGSPPGNQVFSDNLYLSY